MENKDMNDYMDQGEPRNITRISGNNLGFLTGEEVTPGEMVDFLKGKALFRGFGEVLKQLYPHEDLCGRLVAGFKQLTGEEHDSVSRKVRNWLNGKNIPQSRETLFQISFVLGLDEAEATRLLGAAAETGIHYRNPEELVYAYALRFGKSYGEARELFEQVQGICGFEAGKAKRERAFVYTRQVRDAFRQVQSEEELLDFFREHGGELGQLHETAYRKFVELLNLLQEPEGERRYTMTEVIIEYLGMNVPEGRNVGELSALQRLIRKYWPNESSLFKMRSRKEDVTRKVMILLYLITEAFDEEAEDEDLYFLEDLEEDEDTRLEIRIEKMNLFLDGCGMNLLDPGNAFDLLVLYAMKAEDVGERMSEVMDVLFMGKGRRKKAEEAECGGSDLGTDR